MTTKATRQGGFCDVGVGGNKEVFSLKRDPCFEELQFMIP